MARGGLEGGLRAAQAEGVAMQERVAGWGAPMALEGREASATADAGLVVKAKAAAVTAAVATAEAAERVAVAVRAH